MHRWSPPPSITTLSHPSDALCLFFFLFCSIFQAFQPHEFCTFLVQQNDWVNGSCASISPADFCQKTASPCLGQAMLLSPTSFAGIKLSRNVLGFQNPLLVLFLSRDKWVDKSCWSTSQVMQRELGWRFCAFVMRVWLDHFFLCATSTESYTKNLLITKSNKAFKVLPS